ncbi:MAG: DUF692 family multinuclear iron-containing protein [Gammaproteobacteria bacterium]
MLIGINWTSPQTLPIIQQLLHDNVADFCEISVDNFIHLKPDVLRAALSDVPISLHILGSRFLEKSSCQLKKMAASLRIFIDALKPIYVSDHLVKFTDAHSQLTFLAELNYEKDFSHVLSRVSEWQERLGQTIFFENYASTSSHGSQTKFFASMMRETKAGLLFDISNAYIAEINGACRFANWLPQIKQTQHFHVAGCRFFADTATAIDTHDVAVMDDVHALLATTFSEIDASNTQTLVIELDANIDYEFWKHEILTIKKILSTPKQYRAKPSKLLTLPSASHAEIEFESLWHTLFDFSPTSLNLFSQHKSEESVKSFLAWAHQNKLSMNWALHAHLLDWFCTQEKFKAHIDEKIKKELLSAAVTRWSSSGMDHFHAQGILLTSKHFPERAVGLWKSAAAEQAGKIVVLKISNQKIPPDDRYAISTEQGNWSGIQWELLPK